MQKLLVEFKNTSGNAPQVPCSVSGALNREETLSVPHIVLANNSSDEDQLSGKRGTGLASPCHKHAWKTVNADTAKKGKNTFAAKKSNSSSANTLHNQTKLSSRRK